MIGSKSPIFSSMVLRQAYSNTIRIFDSLKKDIIFGVVSLLFGFALYWCFNGLPTATDQVFSAFAFTIAPFIFSVIVVFLWNIWLTPKELVFEFIKSATKISVPSATKREKGFLNWAVWKERSQYSVKEFAAILAKDNPIDVSELANQAGYSRLILEEMLATKLSYIKNYFNVHNSQYLRDERAPSRETKILKESAFEWADKKGFDISHVNNILQ